MAIQFLEETRIVSEMLKTWKGLCTMVIKINDVHRVSNGNPKVVHFRRDGGNSWAAWTVTAEGELSLEIS